MLERALELAIGSILPEDLLTLPEEDGFVDWFDQYQRYDDWRVMTLGVDLDNEAGTLFRRLRDHRLLKVLVFFLRARSSSGCSASTTLDSWLQGRAEFQQTFEAPLANELGIPREEVIVKLIDPGHVLHRDPLRLDEDINFVTQDGDVAPFAERSEIFSAQPPDRWRRSSLAYAPKSRRDDPALATRAIEAVLDLLRSKLAEGS